MNVRLARSAENAGDTRSQPSEIAVDAISTPKERTARGPRSDGSARSRNTPSGTSRVSAASRGDDAAGNDPFRGRYVASAGRRSAVNNESPGAE